MKLYFHWMKKRYLFKICNGFQKIISLLEYKLFKDKANKKFLLENNLNVK